MLNIRSMLCASTFLVAFFIHKYGAAIKHYNNLIVGGGPSGLYTAWRLSSPSGRPMESTAVFEWSPVRLGGRIFTKKFPFGQLLELGGMRFTEDHKILHKVLEVLDLKDHVINFPVTQDRLYYLRGKHFYESELGMKDIPYNMRELEHGKKTASELIELVANRVIGENPPETPREWCRYFDEGRIQSSFNSTVFNAGDLVGNIGFWNLLFDQLGSEAFRYLRDGLGYTSDVINKNAAQALYDSSPSVSDTYETLDEGFSSLFDALVSKCRSQSVKIAQGQRLTKFYWNAKVKKFNCTFIRYNKRGIATGKKMVVTSDKLFLSMPRHSIELIRENEVVGHLPGSKQRKVLKNSKGQYFIESIIQQPAIKIGLLYNEEWWLNADFPLNFENSTYNYGPTITDLPLRQIYYMGNNKVRGKSFYGILASYSDIDSPEFWKSMTMGANQTAEKPDSENIDPLSNGIKVPKEMLEMLRQQLNEVHFKTTKMIVPEAVDGYFINWDFNPFYAGYHAWKPHYMIREAQYYMSRPGKRFNVPLYVTGSAYSNKQAWVEGAFQTAESILIDEEEFGLPPIIDDENYLLICRPEESTIPVHSS